MAIIVGVTGKIKGQVTFSISREIACKIASCMMMGMPVKELDEMSKSALAELGNMIMGNTATIFYGKGLQIDITPPSILTGDNMQFSTNGTQTVTVPIILSIGGSINIDVSFMEEND